VDAAVRARDVRCHDFYSVHKTSTIPSYCFGPIRADCYAARPIYFIFQKTFLRLVYFLYRRDCCPSHQAKTHTAFRKWDISISRWRWERKNLLWWTIYVQTNKQPNNEPILYVSVFCRLRTR
jgi:hypothetical protein